MDQVEVIAVASACFGFGVGYLLAYKLTKGDLIREITSRIDALRKAGSIVAGLNSGKVEWAPVDTLLRQFPGQKDHKR